MPRDAYLSVFKHKRSVLSCNFYVQAVNDTEVALERGQIHAFDVVSLSLTNQLVPHVYNAC